MSSDHPVSGVASRYANALFELADEAGSLDAVAGDLIQLRDMLNESADLAQLVRSPAYSADEQAAAFKALLSSAGGSALVSNFVSLIIRNRRLFLLGDMITGFLALLAEKRGEVSADVTSAHALSDAQLASIGAALKTATGRDVKINTKVDQSLLGGLIVKVGSRMIDSSLKTKLNSLKIAMKEAS